MNENKTSKEWSVAADAWLTVVAGTEKPLKTALGNELRRARRAMALSMAELCATSYKLARSGENQEDMWGVKLKGKSPLAGTTHEHRGGR